MLLIQIDEFDTRKAYSDKLHNHTDNDQNMIKHRPWKCVCEKFVQGKNAERIFKVGRQNLADLNSQYPFAGRHLGRHLGQHCRMPTWVSRAGSSSWYGYIMGFPSFDGNKHYWKQPWKFSSFQFAKNHVINFSCWVV